MKTILKKIWWFIKFAVTAPRSAKTATRLLRVIIIAIDVAIFAWTVIFLIYSDLDIKHKCGPVLCWAMICFFYPWISYVLIHSLYAFAEGTAIAFCKIDKSFAAGTYPNNAFKDYYLERAYCETHGLLSEAQYQLKKAREGIDETHWDAVKSGLVNWMKQFNVLKNNMTEGEIDAFATLLVSIRRGIIDYDALKPIREGKINNVGPYELLVVVFNLTTYSDKKDKKFKKLFNNKQLAQIICACFPGNFSNNSTVESYLSRLNSTIAIKDGKYNSVQTLKASQTEVKVLPLFERERIEDYLIGFNNV